MSAQQQSEYTPNAKGQGENLDRRRETFALWYEKNKEREREKARLRMAKRRETDPQSAAAAVIRWRKNNRAKDLAQRKKHNETARRKKGMAARHDAHVKQWKQNQKALRQAAKIGPPWPPKFSTAAEREAWKCRTDPGHVINVRMRVSIRKALMGAKGGRAWETLVGYTLAMLLRYLEAQLPRRRTIKDFFNGKLHIDHIIPKSMFDVTKPEELKACWALSNLRPLPAKRNLSKGAKRESLL